MYHPERGLTTFEIDERERCERVDRKRQLTKVAALLELLKTQKCIDNEQGEDDE